MPRPLFLTPNVPPKPGDVVEISRRIKAGQRDQFKFLNALKGAAKLETPDAGVFTSEVRVNLLSRYDNLAARDLTNRAGRGAHDLEMFLDLWNTATCSRYATVELGDPVLQDKANGWQAVEMPIVESDYPFTTEREALAARIDEVSGKDGIWQPETPTLQVIEFKASPVTAEQILETAGEFAPRGTQLFNASVRYRRPH